MIVYPLVKVSLRHTVGPCVVPADESFTCKLHIPYSYQFVSQLLHFPFISLLTAQGSSRGWLKVLGHCTCVGPGRSCWLLGQIGSTLVFAAICGMTQGIELSLSLFFSLLLSVNLFSL